MPKGVDVQTKQELLLDFMAEPGVRFEVPPYQRSYAWGALQCDELWRDVMRAAKKGRPHFVGMVLYKQDDDSAAPARLEVVDGQQRLVTVTLILLALVRRMRAEGLSFYGMDADALASSCLLDGADAKLTLARGDRATLRALVEGGELPEHPSRRLLDNLARFEELMGAEGFDAELLWRGLRSLEMIGIRLGEGDNPQAVFESLNSKGVPLTTADLVRNYLLIAESRGEQARLYEQYWEPMQGAFGDDPGSLKLNTGICAWLDVRCESMHWDDEHTPFFVFKVYCEDEYDGTTEDLLRELRGFAMMWAENFRYHGVKKYKSYDWALNGPKTLVSDRPLVKCEDEKLYEFYRKIYGVNVKVTW